MLVWRFRLTRGYPVLQSDAIALHPMIKSNLTGIEYKKSSLILNTVQCYFAYLQACDEREHRCAYA